MLRIKEGFRGERSLAMPKMIIDKLEAHPLGRSLYITDIGFYPSAGYHYRERQRPIDQYVLIHCVEGTGWYRLDGTRHNVAAGDFFVLPAGRPHSYGANEAHPWTIYWVHFKGTLAAAYADGLQWPHRISAARDSRLRDRTAFFEEIFYALKSGYSTDSLLYANSLFHHYLGSLRYVRAFRAAAGRPGAEAGQGEEESAAQLAIHYMQEHLEQPLTLQELARYAGYSPTHFSLMFKKSVGHSPLAYFNLLKIEAACRLLDSTDMRVNQVSLKLGIADTCYFSRLFCKIMGMPPRDYRRRDRG